MKLKIDGQELELVYSFRSNIYFEQITNKNIDFSNFSSNDLITLFYCVFISSLQKAKKPIISMVEFLDIIDDNGGDQCVLNFSAWYTEILKSQYEVIDSMDNEKENKETKKESKKKKN